MPTADQVKALIRSHSEGDDTRFYSIAIQVAAHAARTGHTKLAQDLRNLVDHAQIRSSERQSMPAKQVLQAPASAELVGLLTASYPKTRMSEMALEPRTESKLRLVLKEQRERATIRSHGLTPLRKLLLIGPPGTGKTMTASALAGELGLPLFSIQLDGLITKFMGETAAKLRLVFCTAAQTRAVFLFDEFDALGADRASANDVGEIRRVLNSFLIMLEQDESDSIIVAATNFPKLLDHALTRRFDQVIRYDLPNREIILSVMRSRLALFDSTKVDWDEMAAEAEGLSHAEVARACEQTAKHTILEHRTELEPRILSEALTERRAA
jgi:AAA+ superfamily predicted ATPase